MDTAARYVAPRTCRVVDESDPNRGAEKSSRPLGKYADAAAYVLIAEPGAGKTTAFKSEAASPRREYETVTNFRTFDDKPEWHDKTLYWMVSTNHAPEHWMAGRRSTRSGGSFTV